MNGNFWEEYILLAFFPAPASLLIGPVKSDSVWLTSVKERAVWPESVPEDWTFYSLVLQGQIDQALQYLEGDAWWQCFNRMVLTNDEETYRWLVKERSDQEVNAWLRSVGYVLGFEETVDCPTLKGHYFEWMVWSGFLMEQGKMLEAVQAVERAIENVAADFKSMRAYLQGLRVLTLFKIKGAQTSMIPQLRAALSELDAVELSDLKAELYMTLGMVYHEMAKGRRGALMEAVKCYQEALQFYNKTTHPEIYALLQNNLALAYLAMPMKESRDQLRKAIAVQALREALKVYTRETHPDAWASATLNLANALQYLPTSDPEKRLWQAVALYQELLEVRSPDHDPAGYARVLANQANALAHLGAFSRALPRYQEAVTYFERIGDTEAVQIIQQAIEEIYDLQSVR